MAGALCSTLDPVQVHRVCHVKRFLERWAADEIFRHQLEVDPADATRRYRLEVDPEDIRPLWNHPKNASFNAAALQHASDLVADYCAVRQSKRDISERFRQECEPTNVKLKTWRQRQIARGRSEFTPELFAAIHHPPFAIELSDGCSVGCWFCGVSAKKFGINWEYTHANAQLWKDILAVLAKMTGLRAASRGFLYWATDPLDNPDYELFAEDFREMFGSFPHTTTAQAHRNLQRTRNLLRFATPEDPFLLRLSVLSTRILDILHESFSAEELAFVEIIPQTAGSLIEKVRVGKARASEIEQSPKKIQLAQSDDGRTIACVSGFILNLVKKEVRLVSPCSASDRWPSGYYVYDVGHFDDAADLECVLKRMIDNCMHQFPASDRLVKFRPDLKFASTDNGFRVGNKYSEQLFEGGRWVSAFGEAIQEGVYTAETIGEWVTANLGLPSTITENWLLDLFQAGVLDEQPQHPFS